MNEKSPLSAGISAAFRHRRLAAVLWFGLLLSALALLAPLSPLARPFDDGPFRETILKGWDSWAILSALAFKSREIAMFAPSLLVAAAFGLFVNLFLTSGVIRTLIADVRRPVFRRVVADSAALFKPTLRAFVRYLISLVFWEAVIVAGVAFLLKKIAGKDAPPNNALARMGELWTFGAGLVVYLNCTARFHLARVALAREDSPTSRGAHRVAKQRLRGSRPAAILLVLSWVVVGFAVQAVFTNLGIAWGPATGGALVAFIVFRQIGFFVLAMTRVGYWGSLLAFESARRPKVEPLHQFRPLPFRPPAPPPVAIELPETLAGPEATPAPVEAALVEHDTPAGQAPESEDEPGLDVPPRAVPS